MRELSTTQCEHGSHPRDFQSKFCIWSRLQFVAAYSALADHLGWVSRDPADRTNTALFGFLGGWRSCKPGRAASDLSVLAELHASGYVSAARPDSAGHEQRQFA